MPFLDGSSKFTGIKPKDADEETGKMVTGVNS
jgi:hypothetical protein